MIIKKTKIFIVDDHPIVRQGLRQLLDTTSDFFICGEADNVHSAMMGLKTSKPDAVIVDISLKGSDGLELIKNIHIHHANIVILVLSIYDENIYAERAIRAGAKGYIMKQESASALLLALRQILNGGIYLSENMKQLMLSKLTNHESTKPLAWLSDLSDRELEIYRLIGQGFTNKKIALTLNLSVKTIEVHRENIKKKLALKTSAELIISASGYFAKELL